VEAAVQLRLGYMPQLATADEALVDLATAGPAVDLSATIVRAAAVNQLYAAGVPFSNLMQMAQYISGAWPACPPATNAAVVAIANNSGGDAYVAFASKFVYFFGAPSFAVPIWDSWARSRLRFHMGYTGGDYVTYASFFMDAVTLRTSVSPTPSFRDLDRYLWLSAQCGTTTSGEVGALFGPPIPDPEIASLVATMMGPV